jgi:hypothetical protein
MLTFLDLVFSHCLYACNDSNYVGAPSGTSTDTEKMPAEVVTAKEAYDYYCNGDATSSDCQFNMLVGNQYIKVEPPRLYFKKVMVAVIASDSGAEERRAARETYMRFHGDWFGVFIVCVSPSTPLKDMSALVQERREHRDIAIVYSKSPPSVKQSPCVVYTTTALLYLAALTPARLTVRIDSASFINVATVLIKYKQFMPSPYADVVGGSLRYYNPIVRDPSVSQQVHHHHQHQLPPL